MKLALINNFLKIYNNQKLLLIFLFLFALFLVLIFLLFFSNIGPHNNALPSDYYNHYEPIANSLLAGRGTFVNGKINTWVPPGYPIMLAIIFSFSDLIGTNRLDLVILFNTIITAGAAVFLFLGVQSIFNKKIALISSLLWMSYPFNLWFAKGPHTEVPFFLLLFLAIWLYILALKKEHFGIIFLSGITLGLAVLIRPIGIFIPLLLFLFVFPAPFGGALKRCGINYRKKQILLAVALLFGSLLTVLPWESYVWSNTGNIILLSTTGPGAIATGLTYALQTGAGRDNIAVPRDVLKLMERAKTENLSTLPKIILFSFEELMNHPISFLKLVGLKIIRSWYATSQMWWEGRILAVQTLYLLPSLLGLIYAIKIYKNKLKEIVFLLSIIFYFLGMTVLGVSILRYMVPAMAIMLIFAAIAINVLLEKKKIHIY